MGKSSIVVSVEGVAVNFATKEVLKDVTWSVNKGEIATLIGPNGCGKSTLLKVVTGSLRPTQGFAKVYDEEITSYKSQEFAKRVAFLPQVPDIPKDMTVEELVYCGRYPYQAWWKNTAREDRLVVDKALLATKTEHVRHQMVSSLSGGERQRVWIAMALAQEPEILILDEPTTYLDINHQLEVMELLRTLNKERGLTVIMVLHELNQAAQYSHQIAVLHQGYVVAQGSPREIMTEELLQEVFGVRAILETNEDSTPYIKVQGLLDK